jgi:hypothetical protein
MNDTDASSMPIAMAHLVFVLPAGIEIGEVLFQFVFPVL